MQLALKADVTEPVDITMIPSGRPHRHILITEDNASNLLVATSILDMMKCSYEIAHSGAEACEKIKIYRFDCILMDVRMVGMDGLAATRAIRQWEEETGQPRTIIVGLTAQGLEGDRQACIDAGMDDYLSKPYIPEQLQEKLQPYVACMRETIASATGR